MWRAAALLFVWLIQAAPAAAGLFGSTETPNRRLDPFTKWTGMLIRYGTENPDAPCQPTRIMRCYYQDWKQLLAEAEGKPIEAKLDLVNRYMNRALYITDPVNWGVDDYWATMGEFFRKDGDCEDYAIAKYLTLKALGVSSDDMRVVVVQDENLHVPHAVLAVYVNGQAQILDNQIPIVRPDTAIYHYRPLYSINEHGWWMHRPAAR